MSSIFVLSILFVSLIQQIDASFYDSDRITIPGDFLLGAIFPIRSYGGKENDPPGQKRYKECGDLEQTFVIQSVAFQLSIEYVNRNYLRNYTFGGLVVDECDNAVIGLQSAVRLMAGEIGGLGSANGLCDRFPKPKGANSTFIYGMTGGTNSIISERVEPLFEVFCLPLISTYATAPDFEDVYTYPYFLRTVPSDHYQARAVFNVLKHMGWYSVFLLFEKTAYGQGMKKQFEDIVNDNKNSEDDMTEICIINHIEISNVDPDFDEMKKSLINSQTNIIVLFTDFTTAAKVFQYMKNPHNGLYHKQFQFVGTDGWGRTQAAAGAEDLIANAVTTEFLSFEMPLIKDYMDQLTFGQLNNSINPWLRELVRTFHNCNVSEPFCGEFEPDQLVNLTNIDAGIGRSYYSLEAVYAFAKAFETLRLRYCQDGEGLCEDFYAKSNGSQLMQVLREVKVSDPDQLPRNFEFFNDTISGPPYYSIFQYRYDPIEKTGRWLPIGNWSIVDEDDANGVMNLLDDCAYEPPGSDRSDCVIGRPLAMQSKNGGKKQCRTLCHSNAKRDFFGGNSQCCWSCIECAHFEYVNRSAQGDTCEPCDLGKVPNQMFDTCVDDDPIYPGLESFTLLFAIFLILAAIGFFASLLATAILIWYRKTPVAILASFPLCGISTAAIAAIFASTALNVLKPCDAVCLAQWAVQPFLLTLVIGAVFVHILQMPRDYLDSALAKKKHICASVRTRQVIQLAVICTLEIAFIVFCTVWFRRMDSGQQQPTDKPSAQYVHLERTDMDTIISCSSTMDKANIFILYTVPFLFLCVSLILACRRFKACIVFERRENRRVIWSSGLILLLFIFVATPVFATVQTPVPRAAVQMATLILCSFIIIFFVYTPLVLIMVRRRGGNSWLHLTRNVQEDERITSDQLTLSDQMREGCFCEVYKGTYRRHPKQVVEIAAKMPKKKSLNVSISLADLTHSLLQEILILRQLRESEHVIHLYGVCNDGESQILIFEYIDGGSCTQFIPAHRAELTCGDLISIGVCIADALCFLKEKSIVHRDVKSDNCLVREKRGGMSQHHGPTNSSSVARYHAKLADFGVAVEANAGIVDSRRHGLIPERHTAPEGLFSNFSHASDVWSFGVFLWEMFTLKSKDNATPYEAISSDHLTEHINNGNMLDKPRAAPEDVYENVMKRCWTLEPIGRIDIMKAKGLLQNRGRKVSGDKANGTGGWNGVGRSVFIVPPTPDIFVLESRFLSPSTSVSSGESAGIVLDLPMEKPNIVNVNYKTTTLIADGSLHNSEKVNTQMNGHAMQSAPAMLGSNGSSRKNSGSIECSSMGSSNFDESALNKVVGAYRTLR